MEKEKKSILIIDDDEQILKVLKDILQKQGYNVFTAKNGKEAIRKYETQFFNLTLIDIMLPDIKGTQLLSNMHRASPRTMKIMMTGYPTLENAVNSLNQGADAYFIKPLGLRRFLNVISEKLKEQEDVEKMTRKKAEEWLNNRIKKGKMEPVFVIHGRNLKIRNAIFTFLRSIGIHPLEWSEIVSATMKPLPYMGEILDKAFSLAKAVLVLMTPDDEAQLRKQFRKQEDSTYEIELTPQARPNVLFEAGMAMGRNPDKTIIVQIGTLRPFSDIQGLFIVKLDNTTEKRQALAQRFRAAGCQINLSGTDWHTAGNFNLENHQD